MHISDNQREFSPPHLSVVHLSAIPPRFALMSAAEEAREVAHNLWNLDGSEDSAWRLSGALAGIARHAIAEQITREDRDRIMIPLGLAHENFVPAMFDPVGLGHEVDDALRVVAALAVLWEQDPVARATREPAEIDGLLARARLCRLELDALVSRAERARRYSQGASDRCAAAQGGPYPGNGRGASPVGAD